MYKPFGWENLDLRYGGLLSRMETMHERLIAYLDVENKTTTKLEELEVELEVVFEGQRVNLMLDWARAAKPTYI
ncbi:hypothetical protein BCR35DRAFT_334791 [Leucosporidium creatinivorum]|uniref:Glycoside Hydrolase 20C C-terminal domain-containing protein n=1 Tax=Leucosporidium creatinivorum TaxID=106004 RepID=A0A1Y2DYG6_9BASI|nr:hypothetical protein BCR35DRAFT_334791 [Leucosporidium creatinivorum]